MSKKKIVGISVLVIVGFLFLLGMGGGNYDHCMQLYIDTAQSNANAQRYMASNCPENADKWAPNEDIKKQNDGFAQEKANLKKFLEENKP